MESMKMRVREGHAVQTYGNVEHVSTSAIDTFARLESSGHNWNHRDWFKPNADLGGYFFLDKCTYSDDNYKADLYKSYLYPYIYKGDLFAKVANSSPDAGLFTWPAGGTASKAVEMTTWGTHAIAQTEPTNPLFSASQFLGELREGLPRIVGADFFESRARDFRKMGGEYLNVQFGWVPFLSDLQKFARAVQSSHQVLSDLHRMSGTAGVRRRYGLPAELTTSIVSAKAGPQGAGQALIGQLADPSLGTLTTTTTTYTKKWFSGRYQYYIPDSGFGKYSAEASKLFGVRFTPETLYELAPWSWAFDWFGNLGDVIHNVNALTTDSQVLSYGYVMCHTKNTTTYDWDGKLFIGNQLKPVHLKQYFARETKERVSANPFGFGVTWDTMSPRQAAIAAALGISRVPGRR